MTWPMDTSRILSGGAIAGHLHISWSEQRKRIMRVATLIVSDLIQIATAQTTPDVQTGRPLALLTYTSVRSVRPSGCGLPFGKAQGKLFERPQDRLPRYNLFSVKPPGFIS